MSEGPSSLPSSLARHIDISCVRAENDRHDITALAASARAGDFASAHVMPHWVPELRDLLAGSNTLTGSPVGFPAGGNTTAVKVTEATELLEAGVQELDMVVNIARLRSGDLTFITHELAEMVSLVAGRVPLRSILEVGYLSTQQIRQGCECAIEAGVPWLKTATGWSGHPTTAEHIRIIAEQVGGRAQIKAAGGIRDLSTIRTMADLGVARFGMNTAAALAVIHEATHSATGQQVRLS